MDVHRYERPSRSGDRPDSEQVLRPEAASTPAFAREEAAEGPPADSQGADTGDLLWTPTQGQDATRSLFPLTPRSGSSD